MPGNQLLQMGLFAKKIFFSLFFFSFWKNLPSLLRTPNSGPHHATGLWKHPKPFAPCRPFLGGVQSPARAPASRYLPNGAVLLLGGLVQAMKLKDRDKGLGTPRRLLFQSSFAL